MIAFLDYGAGNVRSVINGIESLGEKVKVVETAEDILSAERLVFPGVGAFGSMMQILNEKKYVEPLKSYLQSGRPFLGICLGLQALFEGSEEAPGFWFKTRPQDFFDRRRSAPTTRIEKIRERSIGPKDAVSGWTLNGS